MVMLKTSPLDSLFVTSELKEKNRLYGLCKLCLKAQNTAVHTGSVQPTLGSALELVLRSPSVALCLKSNGPCSGLRYSSQQDAVDTCPEKMSWHSLQAHSVCCKDRWELGLLLVLLVEYVHPFQLNINQMFYFSRVNFKTKQNTPPNQPGVLI